MATTKNAVRERRTNLHLLPDPRDERAVIDVLLRADPSRCAACRGCVLGGVCVDCGAVPTVHGGAL